MSDSSPSSSMPPIQPDSFQAQRPMRQVQSDPSQCLLTRLQLQAPCLLTPIVPDVQFSIHLIGTGSQLIFHDPAFSDQVRANHAEHQLIRRSHMVLIVRTFSVSLRDAESEPDLAEDSTLTRVMILAIVVMTFCGLSGILNRDRPEKSRNV